MSFSVLMSLYYKESPSYYHACLESLFNQTLPASEVVIVYDGALSDELMCVTEQWIGRLPIKIVELSENVGLGEALNRGLKLCTNELVFRMDTDDVCIPRRFERQYAFMESNPDIALSSSWIAEFDTDPEAPHAVRKVPCLHDDIVKYAKRRNPFNHMAVCFKKSCVESAGGYQKNHLYEDYALWVRMILSGFKVGNLDEILVLARVGNGMEFRRGGMDYVISEINVQWLFHTSGFITGTELFINLLSRMPVRILPKKIRKYFYRTFLRR